jgi:hypothetical protein
MKEVPKGYAIKINRDKKGHKIARKRLMEMKHDPGF